LRAPGSTRALHLTRKQAKGKNASVTHAQVPTEACLPKDAAGNYYDHDFDDFYDVLKKNKNRLSVNPSSREESELLKDEFQKSVDKLRPL
jgi:hypothetical protein